MWRQHELSAAVLVLFATIQLSLSVPYYKNSRKYRSAKVFIVLSVQGQEDPNFHFIKMHPKDG